jgi:hypothetical protein
MKTGYWILCASVLILTGSVSAQSNTLSRRAQLQKARSTQIDVESIPALAPGDDFDVNEFLMKRKDLQGQVVELTFDKVSSLKQVRDGYIAFVSYEKPRHNIGLEIYVPAEGLEFFEDLAKPEIRRRQSVYVYVKAPGAVVALGTDYDKDKAEDERYQW